MHQLIENLKSYEHHYSVYPFGEFVHYTDKRNHFVAEKLILFLKDKGLNNIIIQPTETTIEDTFMELAK
jgi:hypothetical protein